LTRKTRKLLLVAINIKLTRKDSEDPAGIIMMS
jgi:hypothetical protein